MIAISRQMLKVIHTKEYLKTQYMTTFCKGMPKNEHLLTKCIEVNGEYVEK